ncbi:hypothetical protein [Shewanella subflava]|uniref:Uncharacterized protein n=1 Tax=Shewanella subflava TaxID=2986476 RepID=A0ABT3I5T4_9GAMM|nr:hypothetical protein [Shewanella subflava]MCW3171421.1 hypothetical protein [Shewanella subflava]
MLTSLKDSVNSALGVAVILVFALMVGVIITGKISLESLKANNASLRADIVQLNANEQQLTRNNDIKDQQLKKLEQDYKIIIDLNTQNRKRLAALKATHESRTKQANLIKDSSDEPTKDWANALLPADAVQLLQQTRCESGDANQHDLCFTPP